MNILTLKIKRNEAELEPIEYNGTKLDFDETSQRRLLNAYIALDGTEDTVLWTCTDNNSITLSASDIKAIFKLAFTRSNELHLKYIELKTRAGNGETVEW